MGKLCLFLDLRGLARCFRTFWTASLIVLAFDQGSALSIIFIAALISYFPILVGLDSTFKNADKESIEMMNVLNANKRQALPCIN
jgi:ABC-type nitrate/sulfonate/bicarbonate transport system permease component